MPTATQTTSPQVHAVQPSSPDHCILLPGVRWETYESLLADMQDSHAAQFAYDRGVLEIMAPSYEHDNLKHIIAVLVEFLAGEMEIDIEGGGSSTFRREDLAKGFEPDECFYIQHAERVRGKKQIDLAQDPPPDLIIEIDIQSPPLNKFPIFAALGIPEVWRHDGARVAIFTFVDDDYVERAESVVLPKVASAILTELIDANSQLQRPAWLRRVRAWARSSFGSDR
ncbi:MAG: Uma2 family endonuclease [Gammaproteobacteria bacterium]